MKRITTVLLATLTTLLMVVTGGRIKNDLPYAPLRTTSLPRLPTLLIPEAIYNTGEIEFQSHIGPKPFQSWLQLTLDFDQIKPVYDQLLSIANRTLHSRGEAHITVITPPEFDNVLAPVGLTMEEIEKIAKASDIQASEFTIKCLGRSRTKLKGQTTLESV